MLDYFKYKELSSFFTELNVPKLSRVNLFSGKKTLGKAHSSKRYIFMQMDSMEPSIL